MQHQARKNATPIRIVVVEGSREQALAIKKTLVSANFSVKISAIPIKKSVNALKKHVWDIVFTPINKVTPEFIQLYARLAKDKASTPLLIIADDVNSGPVLEALNMGARDVIDPMARQRFLSVIHRELADLDERRNHFLIKSRYHLQQQEKNLSVQKTVDTTPELLPDNDSIRLESQKNKYDLTTGLYSQQYFISELSQVLAAVDTIKKTHAVLYFEFLGVDVLRRIYGIYASNTMLSDIAIIMRDNIGHMGPIARMSNQTYAALVAFSDLDELLPILNSTRALIVERMREALVNEHTSEVVSIGVCMVSKTSENAYHLMAKAEHACDIAKKIIKNGLHIYNPEVDNASELVEYQSVKDWGKQIHLALHDGRFKVVLQMISRLDSSDCVNYELLFRMQDKVSGADIMPGEFIVAADQSGLIIVIDEWVTSQAMKMILADQKQGRKNSFFIKLSNRTVNSNTFIPWLMAEIKKHRIPSKQLTFEIDTTELIKRPIELQTFIRSLNKLKCRVALDYFGTQSNHLSIIDQFDVAYLRLDRSLTHDVIHDSKRLAPIKLIVSRANAANIQTIAEFVEDAKTLAALCNIGIEYIQGNFIQAPEGNLITDIS